MKLETQQVLQGFNLSPQKKYIVLNKKERQTLSRAAKIAEQLRERLPYEDEDVAKLEMFSSEIASVDRFPVE